MKTDMAINGKDQDPAKAQLLRRFRTDIARPIPACHPPRIPDSGFRFLSNMKRLRLGSIAVLLFLLQPGQAQTVRPGVLTGLDVLERDQFAPLRGLKIGLVTNQTGIDRERRSIIDLLHDAPGVALMALFSPEHGIRGIKDEKVDDTRDERTGLPVYSLYGERRAPTPDQLAGIDALVFDIQDVGCRFYTYIATMGECLAASTKAGKRFLVLDRPNPITGLAIEGPVLAAERSFTAWHEIPVRTGMTIGELAKMFAAERVTGAKLTVIPCKGWRRGAWFDETGLPWENPSPNMRSLTAAMLYPGVGLLEFCNVSVGRGTDRPFEFIGAPYINDRELAAALETLKLPGIRFAPVCFTPVSSKFAQKICNGVEMRVVDRVAFRPVDLGMALALTLQRLHPADLQIDRLSKLLAHPATIEAVRAGKSVQAIHDLWAKDLEDFRERRRKFLIYPE